MEIVLSGIGILFLMFSWKHIWQPTILDTERDRLFDLRDQKVREFFLHTPYSLEHPIYMALRNLINSHLRYTERLTFARFLLAMSRIYRPQALDTYILRVFEKKFETNDPAINDLVLKVRKEAAFIMLSLMVERTFLLFLAALVFGIFVVVPIRQIKKALGRQTIFPDIVVRWIDSWMRGIEILCVQTDGVTYG